METSLICDPSNTPKNMFMYITFQHNQNIFEI